MKRKWTPYIAAVTVLVVFIMLGACISFGTTATQPSQSETRPPAQQPTQAAPPPYNSESDFKIDWDTNVKDGVVIIGYTGTRKDVNIPPTIQNNPVTGIMGPFSNTGITSVIIPDSVTSIGDSAFSRCSSLTRVTIPDSVTTIGNYAFSSSALTRVTIPDSVKSIGAYAFDNCRSLTRVTIPDSVTTIGNYAFSSSTLTSVTIGNSVISIGEGAFVNCRSLTSVTIGNSVTTIGNSAFAGTGITSITIPNSVTTIGHGAFSGCTSLASVTIGSSVTRIEEGAFRGTGLTSITIPNSVTGIGNEAFDARGLNSVTFEGTITSRNLGYTPFPGDLRDKYTAGNGGPGTYTRFAGGDVWRKQ